MKPVLFITDSYGSLDHDRDTSLHLISGLFKLQKTAEVYLCTPQYIFAENAELNVASQGRINSNLEFFSKSTKFKISDFHSIHWRKDPPVDLETYRLWNLLSSSTYEFKCYNPVSSLNLWHEKFYTSQYPDWCIPSFISNEISLITNFIYDNKNKKLIAKPSGSAGSRGIEILNSNINIAIEQITNIKKEYGDWIIIQEFESKVLKTGETRVFYLGGKIVGSIKKSPHPGSELIIWPQDISKWPKLELITLDDIQKARADKIAKDLMRHNVYFASIDFIEHKILEINITSPGLLKWLDENMGSDLNQEYWKNII